MHILFLTDNFPPETNAPATRTFEHARRWVEAGHLVTVITCFPNFPEGELLSGYKNKWYQTENMHGIRVVRVKTYIAENARLIRRTLDYISFMISGSIAAVFQKKPDVIVATSPQFFCALKRKPFVLEIRDMWPASIVAVGVMEDSIFIRVMSKIEGYLYKKATSIVVVTNSFKKEIAARGISPSKIHVVLNGVDHSLFSPREKNTEITRKYQLENKFVIGYIGTHGLAHDLPNVLKAIEGLTDLAEVKFIFAGAGAQRQLVEDIVHEKRLHNVELVPQQPRERIPELMSVCTVCLVPLRNSEVFASVIPSKIFECFAMGVPMIMALPRGEATSILESAGAGIIVTPENPEQLSNAIRELHTDRAQVSKMSEQCLAAAELHSRDNMAELMLNVIEQASEVRFRNKK